MACRSHRSRCGCGWHLFDQYAEKDAGRTEQIKCVAELLAEYLVHALRVRMMTLFDATHYAYFDRPEYGRAAFVKEELSFLAEST